MGDKDIFITSFFAVGKYKSIRRAMKRGHVAWNGVEYPKRPFNNRGTIESKLKQSIYEAIREYKKRIQ